MPTIRIRYSAGIERTHPLEGDVILFGRGEDCPLVLNCKGVSRRHGRFVCEADGRWWVEDLGSTNGLILNGKAVTRHPLNHGDVLNVGVAELVFLNDDQPACSRPNAEVTIVSGTPGAYSILERSSLAMQAMDGIRLRSLYDISMRLLDQHVLAGLIDVAASELAATMGAGRVVFGLTCDPQREPDRLIVRGGESVGETVTLTLSVLRRTLESRRAVLITDARQHQSLADAQSIVTGKIQSALCVPLISHEKVTGFLYADSRGDGRSYTEQDLEFATAIGALVGTAVENVQLYDDLGHLFSGMLHAMVSSIDAKDPYTCGHSQRVAWLSRRIALLAGLPEAKCHRVYLSGLLHDVGKIGIPEAVLCKTGRLTEEEFLQTKRHPEIGARILKNVPQVADAIPGVLCHHERINGKGYPAGMVGNDIPLFGRIVGLADAYDAMTSNRTYRSALPLGDVIAEIRRCSGTQFDPELAECFLRQDIEAIHRELTEFGNLPIGPHLEMGFVAGPADAI